MSEILRRARPRKVRECVHRSCCCFPSFGHAARLRRKIGGADRDRTDDLKLAKLPLSQLSYGPDFGISDQMVGPERVERSTSRLSGVRSNHLSYEPEEVFD
jgi:hypothetical protein